MATVLGVALPAGIEWSVCVRDAATGEVLDAADPERVLPAASIGKLLLLETVARTLDLEEPLTRTPGDAVGDSGLWQHLAVDTLPAGELSALLPRLDGRVRGWLAHGADLSMVASAFGLDPLAHAQTDRGLRLLHKTGTDAGVRADAGLLEGPAARLAYAVLARFDDARRDEVLDVMRALGAAMRSTATRR